MTKKIEQLRDDRARQFLMISPESYRQGFDAAWELHERLVVPLIKTLEDIFETNHGIYCDDHSNIRASDALKKYREEVGE